MHQMWTFRQEGETACYLVVVAVAVGAFVYFVRRNVRGDVMQASWKSVAPQLFAPPYAPWVLCSLLSSGSQLAATIVLWKFLDGDTMVLWSSCAWVGGWMHAVYRGMIMPVGTTFPLNPFSPPWFGCCIAIPAILIGLYPPNNAPHVIHTLAYWLGVHVPLTMIVSNLSSMLVWGLHPDDPFLQIPPEEGATHRERVEIVFVPLPILFIVYSSPTGVEHVGVWCAVCIVSACLSCMYVYTLFYRRIPRWHWPSVFIPFIATVYTSPLMLSLQETFLFALCTIPTSWLACRYLVLYIQLNIKHS